MKTRYFLKTKTLFLLIFKGVEKRLLETTSHYNFKKYLEDSKNKLLLMKNLSKNSSIHFNLFIKKNFLYV